MSATKRIVVGMLLGLCAGAIGRFAIQAPLPENGQPQITTNRIEAPSVDKDSDYPDSQPRPTLEEALAATGTRKQLLFARYLQEASFDEVLALTELSYDGKSQAKIWLATTMINQRGAALDPEALVALIDSKDNLKARTKGSIVCVHSLPSNYES